MIYLPPVIEIGTVVIADPGVPNLERIVFRPTEPVNLGVCGILVGMKTGEGFIPVNNLFFWFGEVEIKPPSWVLVFTGKGTARQEVDKSGNPMHLFYWGHEITLFSFKNIAAIAIRFAGVTFGNPLKALPEYVPGAAPAKQ